MNFLLILIFVTGLILFSGLITNNEHLYVYSQSVYSDKKDPQKPAPIILSLEQIGGNIRDTTTDGIDIMENFFDDIKKNNTHLSDEFINIKDLEN